MAAFDMPSGELRSQAITKAREMGVIALPCGTHSIRFRPTLTIQDAEIERGVEVLDRAVRAVL
jgi:L-lysine 6-transaminase